MPTFFTICGSLRAMSVHAFLLEAAEAQLRSAGAEVDRYADLASLPRYHQDHDTPDHPVVSDLRARVAAADGVLLACPTYNLAIPSGMKDLIDWASRPFGQSCLTDKRVGLIGVGVGNSDGAAARGYLAQILGILGATVVEPHTSASRVLDHLDMTARTVDEELSEKLAATVAALLG